MKTELEVNSLKDSDLVAVINLLSSGFESVEIDFTDVSQIMRSGYVFVYRDDDGIPVCLCTVQWFRTLSAKYLKTADIVVDQKHRNKGLGKKFMLDIFEYLQKQYPRASIVIQTNGEKRPFALKMFKSLGAVTLDNMSLLIYNPQEN